MTNLFFPLSDKEAKDKGIEKNATDNKNALFPTGLRKLREEKGIKQGKKISQQELADKIGVTKATISLYEMGDNVPDAKTIVKIANYYDVSTDYLLGLTDIKTPDMNIRMISDRLGLSDGAIDVISNFDSETQKILSTIVENDKFGEILSDINEITNQKSSYNQYILKMMGRINKANRDDMLNIIEEVVGVSSISTKQSNTRSTNDFKTIEAKEYIGVLYYRLENIFQDIIYETTYSKDFDTDILTRYTQLFATDGNDVLYYKVKIPTLEIVQNVDVKKEKERMKKALKYFSKFELESE